MGENLYMLAVSAAKDPARKCHILRRAYPRPRQPRHTTYWEKVSENDAALVLSDLADGSIILKDRQEAPMTII